MEARTLKQVSRDVSAVVDVMNCRELLTARDAETPFAFDTKVDRQGR